MKSKSMLIVTRICFVIVALCMFSGCASTHMKGTPFYTGEYKVRQGPVEDRVNFWPVLYYRNPALSVLWPFFELTEEHFAFRPIMSAYGMDEKEHVYNVLWPLAQYNQQTDRHRVFPVFWGDDRVAVFPLYWHRGNPFSGKGRDTLFPLWSFSKDARGRNAHLLYPIMNMKDYAGVKGWRVWPVAGHYSGDQSSYSFALWPLMHRWSNDRRGTAGSTIIPLYHHGRSGDESKFLSLLYSSKRGADGSNWQLVPPVFYRYAGTESSHMFTPIYFCGSSDKGNRRWNLLLPISYEQETPDSHLYATILGGFAKKNDRTSWIAGPGLAFGSMKPDGYDLWLGGALTHFGKAGNARSDHVFPLFYNSSDESSSLFLSLPWSHSRRADGSKWNLIPPLYLNIADQSGNLLLTPLYARGGSNDGNTKWSTVMPLYYHKTAMDRRTLVAPPLLSVFTQKPDAKSLWTLGGMARASWGKEHGANYLFPVFYSNPRSGAVASPVAARWKNEDGGSTWLFPPALSWLSKSEERSDLWLTAGLARFSWGEDAGRHHVLPLYCRNAKKESFLSAPIMKWKRNDTDVWVCPPLLTSFSTDGKIREVNTLLGIFRNTYSPNPEQRKGHLAPLYYYEGNRRFFTPVFGWNRSKAHGYVYPLTPLLAVRTGDYNGGWLFPVFSHEGEKRSGHYRGTFLWAQYWKQGTYSGSRMAPIYSYRNTRMPDDETARKPRRYADYGKELVCLPACWYRNVIQVRPDWRAQGKGDNQAVIKTRIKKHGFFPLWSYSRSEGLSGRNLNVGGRILLALYDYKREVGPVSATDQRSNDYTRSRVLWRLWHYEKLNNEVSVDVFPGITYDRKEHDFKKFAFLWRFFRYQRDALGKKVDFLFIPVLRTRARK